MRADAGRGSFLMSFLPHHPPESEKTIDEPGTMLIGGPRSKRLWRFACWLLAFTVVGAGMVGLFIRFGTTTLWASGLVAFMLGYMALMSRWASGNDHR